jgi:hypothetical protein
MFLINSEVTVSVVDRASFSCMAFKDHMLKHPSRIISFNIPNVPG